MEGMPDGELVAGGVVTGELGSTDGEAGGGRA